MSNREGIDLKDDLKRGQEANKLYRVNYSYLDFILTNKRLAQGACLSLNSNNKALERVEETLKHTIGSQIPVLLTGEESSGKTYIAKRIYEAEKQISSGSLFVIDCRNLSNEEEGARSLKELLSESNESLSEVSVIVLKEVSYLTQVDQGHVLKFLQKSSGKGSEKTPRLIATSSRDIYKLVERTLFKQDLYYRLYVLQFKVPSFKERQEDFDSILKSLLSEFGKEGDYEEVKSWLPKKLKGKNSTFLEDGINSLRQVLSEHYEGDSHQAKGKDLEYALPKSFSEENGSLWLKSIPKDMTIKTIETHVILEVLKNNKGNRTHTAKSLGISLRTLRNKINEYLQKGYQVTKPEK